jgi:pimeloyl-ACP methyl ester carboxylesterase
MRKLILIAAVIGLAACSSAEENKTVQSAHIDDAADLAVIDVTRFGNPQGRTVVLVPGLASSTAVWDATLPLLEADYDVRIVQVAGFSGAEPVNIEGAYTDAIATALTQELQTHPAKSAVLVGHSMGGFVSMKTALAAPEVVDELVIVDSMPFLAGLFFPGATPEIAAVQAPIMSRQMANMPRAAFDAQQKAGLGRLVKTAQFLPILEDWSRASDQGTVATVMGELMGADLRADLAQLQAETLIMVPYDSAMGVPREQIEETYKAQYDAAPNAAMEIFDDSFHFIMIDQPDAFHARLLAALAD